MKYIKHLNQSQIFDMASQIDILPHQIISKTLTQNDYVSLTLFGFAKNEQISTHKSKGDAMITVLQGTCHIIIDNNHFDLKSNDTIVMPANLPHSVTATSDFKMMLTVIFPIA